MAAPSRVRSMRKAGLVLLSALLSGAAFEGVLRLAHHRRLRDLEAQRPKRKPCTRATTDPRLVYELIPGRCGANSHGYLGREHSLEKPHGMHRIVVVGDSIAQGDGVAPGESFGDVLEGLLNAGGEGPFEVIVLARSGYSTSQQLVVLEREAYAYEPDLVVWSYVLNDAAHPIYHNANGELGLYHHRPRVHALAWLSRRLFLAREAWKGRGCRREYHALLHCVYRDQVAAGIRRIGEISKSRRVPALFVIHPVFEKGAGFEAYSLAAIHDDLKRLASESGIAVLDLLEAYRGNEPAALKRADPPGWHDPWHPNAAGHRLAAEALHAALAAKGLATRAGKVTPAAGARPARAVPAARAGPHAP